MTISPPTANLNRARSTARAARHAAPDELARLMPVKPIYRPSDAAELCGISEDRVTDAILLRPNRFPTREFRSHEWDADEFVGVVSMLCCYSPKARATVEQRINRLLKK